MLITKRDNFNHHKTIKFNQLIDDLELFTGKKQNRTKLCYRLLSNETLYCNKFTYFNKINGGF